MWLSARPNIPKDATWEEYSEFYKDLSLNFTVSEFDREHRVEVYCNDKNSVNGSDSDATKILTHYQIQTHQGTSIIANTKTKTKNQKPKAKTKAREKKNQICEL